MADPYAEFVKPGADASVDPYAEFVDSKPAPKRARRPQMPAQSGPLAPIGTVHDGDTFALNTGVNGRLLGVDAFELRQMGRMPTGPLVPIGQRARDLLTRYATPSGAVKATGASTYGRPVMTLDNDGDAGDALVRDGWALAAPEYLKADPARALRYMQSERLARRNLLGAYDTQFATPKEFRQGNGSPWEQPEFRNTKQAGDTAVFFDDRTPQQGLRPEVDAELQRLWLDMRTTPEQLRSFAKANNFEIVEQTIEARQKAGRAGPGTRYASRPRLTIDPGDGRLGAAARGYADPINMLDEQGGIIDSLGLTGGRENVFNSDRRFGDIYWNNVDQNRGILAHDDQAYPWWRFGGQLASGLTFPGLSAEGVGFTATRAAIRNGASRYAAQVAARNAVTRRLGIAGAVEGGAAGVGQGETWQERVGGGLIGVPTGFAAGTALGVAAPKLAEVVGRPFSRLFGREGEGAADSFADGAVGAAKAQAQDGSGQPSTDAALAALDRVNATRDLARGTAPATDDLAAAAGTLDRAAASRPSIVSNIASVDEAGALGPKSLLSFAPPNGAPGISVLKEGDHLATAVFRDADGKPRGAAQVPLSDEARGIYDPVSVYVDPEFRRQGVASQLYDALRRDGHPIDQYSGTGDLTPEGAAFVNRQRQAMASEYDVPTLYGPEMPAPASRALSALSYSRDLADKAQGVRAGEFLPLPANRVDGIEEAARIERGRFEPVRAPDERDALATRNIPSQSDGTRNIKKRGPSDLVTFLRTQGGLKPKGGELEFYGIDNTPRRGVDLAGPERQLGRLVDPANGLDYDEAAYRAWQAGYFPDHAERPTVQEFLEALGDTHSGSNRRFSVEDADELADYQAARQQRYDVEAAQDAGAPRTLDRGQPVGLDDLDANAPPVRAYEEWGDQAPNLAGNIRLDKLDSPQSIARALAVTDRVAGGFDAARRGRITQAETASLADELGMTADDLLKRRQGQAFNAEQALAARQLLARSGTDLVNLAKRIDRTDNAGDELDAAFREAWLRHAAIQEQVAGMTAEAGRALAQFRQVADASAVDRVLPSLGDLAGGSTRLRDVAKRIVDLDQNGVGPGGVNRFTLNALKPRFRDKLVELYYNSILSGPATHAVNILSNTMTAVSQIPEHLAAAGVGAVRRGGEALASRALGRDVGNADRVLFSEVGARSVGLLQGTKEGLVQAARTMRSGETSDAVSKVEQRIQQSISGVKGSIIRTPTRALAAEDELFKAMARRMELSGLAVRQAAKEGLRGDQAKARAAELLANPTDDMLAQSFEYGRYLTFQTPLPHDSIGAGISKGVERFNVLGVPVLKLVVPFVRTPMNILKYAGERSPAAPFMRSFQDAVRAGGAKRDLAVAKIAVGTGIMALAMEWASEGKLTGGGPADEGAMRVQRADGWQPYSVKIGDTYYSYARLDPFATILGVAADFAEYQSHMTEKQRDNLAMLMVASTVDNLSNKVWLSGVSDLNEAIRDPQRYGDSYLNDMVARLAVPAAVSQVARAVDPTAREARTLLDAIKARVPGLSSSLLPRRDVWGEAITREGGVGPDVASPILRTTDRNTPLARQLLADGYAPGRLPRGDYTPEQYNRLAMLAGRGSRDALEGAIRDPYTMALPVEDRVEYYKTLVKAARKAAKGQLAGKGGADPYAEFVR